MGGLGGNCKGMLDSSILQLAHDTSGVGARGSLSMTFWPTLPDARETLVAQILAVVREVGLSNERGNRAIGDLLVRVVRSHDAVYVAHQDRFDLKCAEFAMTPLGQVIAA